MGKLKYILHLFKLICLCIGTFTASLNDGVLPAFLLHLALPSPGHFSRHGSLSGRKEESDQIANRHQEAGIQLRPEDESRRSSVHALRGHASCRRLGIRQFSRSRRPFRLGFKKDMERGEAEQLVRKAIRAGIFNNLGSGSNVDICVITKDKVDYIRPFDQANQKGVRQGNYRYKKGTTGVLKGTVKRIPCEVVSETVAAMDTS